MNDAANNALFDVAADHSAAGEERALAAIESGADVNAFDSDGRTALHQAVRQGNLRLARVLLEHGARVDIRDNDGELAGELALQMSVSVSNDIGAEYRRRQRIAELLYNTASTVGIQLKWPEPAAEPASQEPNELHDRLFDLVDAAWLWGKANGHPTFRNYPQFDELRTLGEAIGADSGKRGMQAALSAIKERARPVERERSGSDYLGGYTAIAEKAWIGIEGWMY